MTVSDAGAGRARGRPRCGRRSRRGRDGRGGAGDVPPGGSASCRWSRARPGVRCRATTSASSSSGEGATRAGSRTRSRSRGRRCRGAGTPLSGLQSGDTRTGEDRARAYRWPTSPFSILGIFGVDPSVNDDGKEKIYSLDIPRQAVNAGVVVSSAGAEARRVDHALLSSNQPIHPWFLGSLDENDVLGYAGIPVNVNGQLPDFLYSIGAAGGVFLPPGRYYVSVDSGRDLFTGARSPAGTRCARG